MSRPKKKPSYLLHSPVGKPTPASMVESSIWGNTVPPNPETSTTKSSVPGWKGSRQTDSPSMSMNWLLSI